MKRVLSLFLAFSLIFTVMPIKGMAQALPKDIFSQEVRDEFGKKGYLDVLIQLENKRFNTTQVLPTDDEETVVQKRKEIIKNLKENAKISQNEVWSYLEDGQSTKQVELLESYYSTNTIRAIARIDVIEDLSRFDSIKEISLNQSEEQSLSTTNTPTENQKINWSLDAIDAMKVWNELGYTGEGVTVGIIDSGVNVNHPNLKESFRGYDPETGKITGEGNWIDLIGDKPLPIDDYGHGSGIAGVAVGNDSGGRPIGVAPGSKWIAARAFSGEYSLNTNLIKAGEWMLAPGGDPAKAPDIINNSWGGKSGNEAWFNELLDTWLAAGIFPVFAAGNEKGVAEKGSIENPASLLDAFSVGAIDRYGQIGTYSKRGPSPFDSTSLVIKPEIVAPGDSIISANKIGTYSSWTGTSLAAPHVTGVVALMKQANPNLGNKQIRKILIETADPKSDSNFPSSPNMAYGYGILNAYRAVQGAKNYTNTTIPMERIRGKNRLETAVMMSSKFFTSSEVVYVANGFRFSDSLAVGPLTKAEGAGPLLLVSDTDEPQAVVSEISRLDAKRVIIVGGEGAVPKSIADAIELGTGAAIERIKGKNRFETNKKIAERIFEKRGGSEVYLANGFKDADALSISAQASRNGVPILLTGQETLDQASKAFIESKEIKKVTIIGGQAAVSTVVNNELKALGRTTEVISGRDRFETSLQVNEKFFPSVNTIYLASGLTGADALAISPKAGRDGHPVQLVHRDRLSPTIESYLVKAEPKNIYILGGSAVISDETRMEVEDLFR